MIEVIGFLFAIFVVSAIVCWCSWSNLSTQMEELADDLLFNMRVDNEYAEKQDAAYRKAMKELGILRQRVDALAEAQSLKWTPQRRVQGHWSPSTVPSGFAVAGGEIIGYAGSKQPVSSHMVETPVWNEETPAERRLAGL